MLHVPIIRDLRARGWVYDYNDPTRPTGATRGAPDFKVWAEKGRFFVVECKTKTGKLSKDQIKFKDAIQALGHRYYLARSMSDWRKIVGFAMAT
jgi:hypothetical protein